MLETARVSVRLIRGTGLRLAALALCYSSVCLGAVEPMATAQDARIKTVVYSANEVVELRGHFGRTIHVQFAPYEIITDVGLGDKESWVTATVSAKNAMVLKPQRANASTNLIVVTNKRTYNFALEARGEVDEFGVPKMPASNTRDMTYAVRFSYPDDERELIEEQERHKATEVTPAMPIDAFNFSYTYSGSTGSKPMKVFDDGNFTYFTFDEKATVPAFFSVDADGNEALVNFHKRGNYYVIERLESQFTLRSGEYVTCIFNEERPQPRIKAKFKKRLPV